MAERPFVLFADRRSLDTFVLAEALDSIDANILVVDAVWAELVSDFERPGTPYLLGWNENSGNRPKIIFTNYVRDNSSGPKFYHPTFGPLPVTIVLKNLELDGYRPVILLSEDRSAREAVFDRGIRYVVAVSARDYLQILEEERSINSAEAVILNARAAWSNSTILHSSDPLKPKASIDWATLLNGLGSGRLWLTT